LCRRRRFSLNTEDSELAGISQRRCPIPLKNHDLIIGSLLQQLTQVFLNACGSGAYQVEESEILK